MPSSAAAIVARPILHIGDQLFACTKGMDDVLDNVDIGALVVSADIIYLTLFAAREHGIDRATVIADVQPVPNLHAVPIDRQRLALHAVVNHKRDELLRELVGAIVVGAARNIQR